MAIIDLLNRRFGRLLVIGRANNIGNHTAWLCQCDCGLQTIVRCDHLLEGSTKSCRCLEKEKRDNGEPHHIHGGRNTRIYSIWSGMRKRCENHNCKPFTNYGGRGIKVCEEWADFVAFRDWALSHGYAKNLSIDRINNDGNYEPSNCRWATAKQQANNRRCRKQLCSD